MPENEIGKAAARRRGRKQGLERGCRNARFEMRVPESEVWRRDAGKRGLKCGCRKARCRVRVPESEIWRAGAGKRGWSGVRVRPLESRPDEYSGRFEQLYNVDLRHTSHVFQEHY